MKNQKDRRAFETREKTKILKYRERTLGKITVQTTPHLSEREVRDLIREMSPSQKIHMEVRAHPVHKICEMYKITPEQYLFREDLMIYTANRGYKNLREVKDNDPKAAKLIKKMGLEDELFNDFSR